MKLNELKLHATVVEALAKEGFVNLGDTKGMTEEELIAIPGVGASSAQVILEAHAEREAANEAARKQREEEARKETAEAGEGKGSRKNEQDSESEQVKKGGGDPAREDVADQVEPSTVAPEPDKTKDDGRDEGEPPNLAATRRPPNAEEGDPAAPPADHAKSAETLVVEDDGTERPELVEADEPLRWSDQQLQHICALDRECGRILDRKVFNFVNGIWQGHGDETKLAKANGFTSRHDARVRATDDIYRLFEHYSLLQARSMA